MQKPVRVGWKEKQVREVHGRYARAVFFRVLLFERETGGDGDVRFGTGIIVEV